MPPPLRVKPAKPVRLLLLCAAAAAVSGCPRTTPPEAADGLPAVAAPKVPPARCDDFAELKQPFFGDLHVHTGWSLDAYTFGSGSLTPADGIRFARGGSKPSSNSRRTRTGKLLWCCRFASTSSASCLSC